MLFVSQVTSVEVINSVKSSLYLKRINFFSDVRNIICCNVSFISIQYVVTGQLLGNCSSDSKFFWHTPLTRVMELYWLFIYCKR